MSLDFAGVKWALSVYSNTLPLTHPVVSPIFYPDFSGFPPILIQAGTSEVLVDDATVLAKRLKEDGVNVELELYRGMFHVFQAFPFIGRAKQVSLQQIARFVDDLECVNDPCFVRC